MTRGQLPKAYLRVDPNIDQSHPDNLGGFIELLCVANRQPVRGQFRDRSIIDHLLGKPAVTRLLARGDVVIENDGRVTVPGWDIWQEGDLGVGERVRRYRMKHQSNGNVTPVSVTKTLPPSEAVRQLGSKAVTSLSSEREDARATDVTDDDPVVAFHERTGQFPSGKLLSWVNDLGARHGEHRVAAMIRGTPMTSEDPPGYLRSVQNRLRLEDHAAEKREARDEKARNAEKREPVSPVVAQLRDALRAKEATA